MPNRLRLVVAGAALVALIGAGCTSGDGNGDGAGTLTAPSVQASLSELLQEHIYLLGTATNAAFRNVENIESEAFRSAAAALDKNSERLGATIESIYPGNKDPFMVSWRSHIGFFVDYVAGIAINDGEKKNKAISDLNEYRTKLGSLLNAFNPELSVDAVAAALEPHINSLLLAIDSQAVKDPQWFSVLKRAVPEGENVARVLASGIDSQKELPGRVGERLGDLRSALPTLFQEHIYLSAAATNVALTEGVDTPLFVQARAVLNENSEELSDFLEGVYPGRRDEFLTLWNAHIDLFVAYTLSATVKDDVTKKGLVLELSNFRVSLGALINSLNPKLPADKFATLLEPHVATLTAVIDAQASKNPEWYALLVEAAKHGPIIGNALADAIVAQMPETFAI